MNEIDQQIIDLEFEKLNTKLDYLIEMLINQKEGN